MAIKAVKMLDMKFHIPLKLNDLPTSDVVGLGYEMPWCRAFPFSWLKHPQYVGTVLFIWGFFLVLRFPHDDWYILPIIETVYYVLGACFEQ